VARRHHHIAGRWHRQCSQRVHAVRSLLPDVQFQTVATNSHASALTHAHTHTHTHAHTINQRLLHTQPSMHRQCHSLQGWAQAAPGLPGNREGAGTSGENWHCQDHPWIQPAGEVRSPYCWTNLPGQGALRSPCHPSLVVGGNTQTGFFLQLMLAITGEGSARTGQRAALLLLGVS